MARTVSMHNRPRWFADSRALFVGHFFEMLAAMIVGMVVLGGLVSLICTLLGHEDLLNHIAVLALLMPAYMTTGMTVWMRFRGHEWRMIAEMGVAMFLPFLVLLVPFATGAISGGVVLALGHVLMLVTMLAVMLFRRRTYAALHDHQQLRPAATASAVSSHLSHHG